eukprot:scaffold157229_cov31-Tisochrysis_lutea.AAC.2
MLPVATALLSLPVGACSAGACGYVAMCHVHGRCLDNMLNESQRIPKKEKGARHEALSYLTA